MPGALSLPSILPTSWLDNLAAINRQRRHPVYNALGRQVGSYETLDALCQGKWLVFTGETQPPTAQLYVNDFWGRRVPLATQCVRAAKAGPLNITQPQTVQPASAVKAVAAANQGTPAILPPVALFDPFVGQADQQDHAASVQLGTYAIWGALAVLGVSLLASGGRR